MIEYDVLDDEGFSGCKCLSRFPTLEEAIAYALSLDVNTEVTGELTIIVSGWEETNK